MILLDETTRLSTISGTKVRNHTLFPSEMSAWEGNSGHGLRTWNRVAFISKLQIKISCSVMFGTVGGELPVPVIKDSCHKLRTY